MSEPRSPMKDRGFTLLELSIVLLVSGLVLAGGLGPLQAQLESRERGQTLSRLEQARAALLGFAGARGRLPCPDTDGDGYADPLFDPAQRESANCSAATGLLPVAELGLAATDAWGSRFAYRVTAPRFTWPDADGLCNGGRAGELDLCARGDIRIRSRGDDPRTREVLEGKAGVALADEVPALVWSFGRNARGTVTADGHTAAVPVGADERDNNDGDARYTLRAPSRGEPGCSDDADESRALCEFDDLGTWLPLVVLQECLITAQRLP